MVLVNISKSDGYHYPGKNWIAGTITTDMREGLRTTGRTKHLAQWNENIDPIKFILCELSATVEKS